MKKIHLVIVVLLTGCQSVQDNPSPVPMCPQGLKFAERDLSGEYAFDSKRNVYLQENGDLCRMV